MVDYNVLKSAAEEIEKILKQEYIKGDIEETFIRTLQEKSHNENLCLFCREIIKSL
jgi:uncharacterized protein (UPF0147 family)